MNGGSILKTNEFKMRNLQVCVVFKDFEFGMYLSCIFYLPLPPNIVPCSLSVSLTHYWPEMYYGHRWLFLQKSPGQVCVNSPCQGTLLVIESVIGLLPCFDHSSRYWKLSYKENRQMLSGSIHSLLLRHNKLHV